MPATSSLALPLLLPLIPVTQPSTSERPPVVVVEGDFLGSDGDGLAAESQRFFGNVKRALTAACVPFETSKDSTVEEWGLPQSCSVAILPYSRAVSADELAEIRAFLQRGGKVIACYVGPDEVLAATGVRPGPVIRVERPGQFSQMAFRRDTLPALPDGITQTSWNVRSCQPAADAVVVATWANASGVDSGLPAVVLGQGGAFISHVLAGGDDYRKGQLLRAIIGHFCPEIWPPSVRAELAELDAVGRFGTLARLVDYLDSRRQAGHGVDEPLLAGQRALGLREEAQTALARGDSIAAIVAASLARTSAMQAFWATYPSKPGELRGAWIIYRGRPTWEDTMHNLAAANMNAVMPRFASAGVAYYPSDYLPESDYSKQNGDQVAQACAAAQKHRVPVHARMLALFIYEAPDGVQEAYRKAGRLMVNTEGETTNWLCPSHPENRKAVLGCCLEMASKYPVAGIQLDYIRYPWRTYCYCPTCKAKFQAVAGVTVDKWPFDCYEGKYRGRFADWRREQINSLVREIRLRLKDLNPDLWFSADVFVNWEGHRVSFGQDWKAWVDEGLCDFVCPMDYFGDDDDFVGWVTKQRAWTRDDVPMCIGLGPRVENVELDPQHLLKQIELSRKLGGDGFVLFDYDERLAAEHLPVVGAGPSSTPSHFSVGPPYVRSKATPNGDGIRIEVTLDTIRRFGGPPAPDAGPSIPTSEVVVSSAKLSVHTADAWPVYDLGTIEADRPLFHDLKLGEGSYRLCAEGSLARPGKPSDEPFVRWGPLFDVG